MENGNGWGPPVVERWAELGKGKGQAPPLEEDGWDEGLGGAADCRRNPFPAVFLTTATAPLLDQGRC